MFICYDHYDVKKIKLIVKLLGLDFLKISGLTLLPLYLLIWSLCLHFSDGAGRSGVYLAIDANIELSEEDGVFDVYGYLVKMRAQRIGLVETLVS